MNTKLLLQDLIDRLADAGDLKKKDAEEFLRAFFKLTEDALFEGETVKIAGLGTFKLMLVSARKSVNVTTGEEIEIREHYKVSFLPDPSLKDAVNKPYAHLEPVELDVALDQSQPTTKPESTKSAAPKAVPQTGMKTPKVTRSIPEEPTPTPTPTSTSGQTTEQAEPDKVTPPNTATPDPEKAKKPSKRFRKKDWFVWGGVMLLLSALGIWSWQSNVAQKREDALQLRAMETVDSLERDAAMRDQLAEMQAENLESDSVATAAEVDTSAQPKAKAHPPTPVQAAVPTPAKAPVKTPVSTKPAVTTPATAAQKAPVASKVAPVASKKPIEKAVQKPVVAGSTQTAAAPASKVPSSITLQAGQRLTLLALKYYGHKAFWVYIYEANKDVIKDPDNVPAGITLRMPTPDRRLMDAQNASLVDKAKAKQMELLGR
jgi:nucleoid DNA-binding protein